MSKAFSVVFILIFTLACSTSHSLSSEAQEVKVIYRKPKNCTVTGRFKGVHEKGSLDLAKNQARNMASKKDSNAIFFDEEFSNGQTWTAVGIGYKCPNP